MFFFGLDTWLSIYTYQVVVCGVDGCKAYVILWLFNIIPLGSIGFARFESKRPFFHLVWVGGIL